MRTDLEKVAIAEDTVNLLEHIAWSDVIKPGFEAVIAKYKDILVKATMDSGLKIAPLEIAARIYGLQWAMDQLETIVKDGERARKTLSTRLLTPLTSEEIESVI